MDKNGKMLSDFKEVLPFFDYNLNDITPNEISAGNSRKFWWKCNKGHSYECNAYNKTVKSQGCPYCANRKVLVGYNDLATTHPEIAKDWDYNKNDIMPKDVVAGAGKRVSWICNKCEYSWESAVAHRGKRNHSCPACMNRIAIKGRNDVFTTDPHIKPLWDYDKNTINHEHITRGTNVQIWWKCDKGHSLKSNINKLCNGISCIYCLNQRLLVGFNDLATVRPDLSKQWDCNKNILKPEQVLVSSKKKYHWICDKGHSFYMSPSSRHYTKHGLCGTCYYVGGFRNDSAGILYFIENKTYKSYKVGITNVTSNRLEKFEENGWKIIYTYHSENGKMIRNTETKLLRWIRKDLMLPQYLSKSEMGIMEGQTETFSSGIKESIIISKIKELTSDS